MEDAGSDNPISSCEAREFAEMGTQKIPISDPIYGLQCTNIKADNFVVDMEHFSHLTDKDTTANSRLTRGLSRKGAQHSSEKKTTNSSNVNEGDATVVATSSPRAVSVGGSTPEKSVVVTVGTTPTDFSQVHHQITIMSGGNTTARSKCSGKRFSFRRFPPSWVMEPRKIFIFFAALSTMGSMLVIYLTLSVSQVNGDGSALDW